MSSSRSNFLSGMILGTVLGLAAGHFTIWNQFQNGDGQANQIDSSPYFPEEMQFDLGQKSASLPPEYYGFQGEDQPDQKQQQVTAPFENAIAFETEVTTTQGQQLAELDQSIVRIPHDPAHADEPQPLSIPEAQPLKEHTAKTEQEIRALIDRELPNSPATQKDIWYESLKDLDSGDVSGVLKMWKLFGGPASLMAPTDDLENSFNSRPIQVPQAKLSVLISMAIALHRQNILMNDVSGYKRTVPSFTETLIDGQFTITDLKTRSDFARGKSCITDHPFDLMIEGPGMFEVKSAQGDVFYTACGQFSLTATHQLCLVVADEEYILQPEIVIPSQASGFKMIDDTLVIEHDTQVAEAGKLQVSIIDQKDLTSAGNGLFQANDSARVFTQPAAVIQGQYERSNVDVTKELTAIQALEQFID